MTQVVVQKNNFSPVNNCGVYLVSVQDTRHNRKFKPQEQKTIFKPTNIFSIEFISERQASNSCMHTRSSKITSVRAYVKAEDPFFISGNWKSNFILGEHLLPVCETPQNPSRNKLRNLSDETVGIIRDIRSANYKDALKEIAYLSFSVRELALSGKIPEDVADTISPLSSSIDECNRLLFEGMRSNNVSEIVEQQGILKFLEGVRRLLQRFSEME